MGMDRTQEIPISTETIERKKSTKTFLKPEKEHLGELCQLYFNNFMSIIF